MQAMQSDSSAFQVPERLWQVVVREVEMQTDDDMK